MLLSFKFLKCEVFWLQYVCKVTLYSCDVGKCKHLFFKVLTEVQFNRLCLKPLSFTTLKTTQTVKVEFQQLLMI